ncbi:MAG: cytochrome c [Chloroflexi bacterium]|nr:cytochrome c [Chloroflexota bacterium]
MPTDDPLARGKLLFDKTAGGMGCAQCHGLDGKGNGPAQVNAPNIRGKNEGDLRTAISGGVPMMSFVKLNDEEITAVVAYLTWLNTQP